MTQIWGHRGNRAHAPENTLLAYRSAVEAGATGVELDVHLTHDGEIVIFHDETVRAADGGSVEIKDASLDSLRRIDVGDALSGFQPLPTLDETLAMLAPTGITVNIELKTSRHAYPGLGAQVLECVAGHAMFERVVLSSFNPATVAALRVAAPGVDSALLWHLPWVRARSFASRHGLASAHPHEALLRVPGALERWQRDGLMVRTWTVNDPRRMRALAAAGVDVIMTDDVPLAVATLSDMAESQTLG